jgi:hypothetical protein
MPIIIDDDTDVWTTYALPMLYVPRHLFIKNSICIEKELGSDKYANVLYKSGYKSAYNWCAQQADEFSLFGDSVFEHYMKILSQQGWGAFIIEHLDIKAGRARVRFENSAFLYLYGKVNRKVDYMFTGWFAGAMDQIANSLGYTLDTVAEQIQCAYANGGDYSIFEVTPRKAIYKQ